MSDAARSTHDPEMLDVDLNWASTLCLELLGDRCNFFKVIHTEQEPF